MIESATIRWLAAIALRSPVVWLLTVGIGAAWPLVTILLAVGITTATKPPAALLYELGFVAAQLGAILAITALSQGLWWLSRTTPLRRFRAEFVGIATGSLALILSAWVVPVVLSIPGDSIPLGHLLSTACFAALRSAAIGVCILALPMRTLGKAALFPICVWLFPTTFSGNYWGLHGIHQCLDLAGDFQFPWTEESPASVWQASILPIFGLCLLQMAEATRKAFRSCATPS
ncbi:MAG: hypothetical protein GY930_05395 [bacterium]|nr:hypothetical protein [bacterium]